MSAAVEAQGLRKRFYTPAPVDAVRRFDLVAQPGEVVGLLGPNGAGKTTTLRMLATLLSPDDGTARIAGFDTRTHPEEVRAHLGYLSTHTGLYPRLTPRELLLHFARVQGVERPRERVEALVAHFDIGSYADRRCDRLSTGQRQKVSIARAIVHDPPVVIFDEPTLGLDVVVAQTVLDFVEQARADGRCILYSTHIMREAERLCDRIAVMANGRVMATDTLEGLRAATGERYLEDVFLALVRDGEPVS